VVWTVTLDQTNPTVLITTNSGNNFATQNSPVNLAGTASDNVAVNAISWRINGGGFSTTGVGGTPTAWTITGSALNANAVNTIDVQATDTAGNTSIATIVVTHDNVKPVVAITSPTSSGTYTTGAISITLGGSSSDTGGSGVASATWSRAEGGGATGAAT